METSLESLRKARALLTDPTHWTKGAFARAKDQSEVGEDSHYATSWCAMGALNRGPAPAPGAIMFLAQAGPKNFGLAVYNDNLATHDELLAWFDRAIALAEPL